MKTKRKEMVEAVPEKTRDVTLFDEMDRMFDTLFHRGWLRPFQELWEHPLAGEDFEIRTPRMDVIDRDDEILVRAELPGVKKDDLEIDLTRRTLTIKGEHRKEEKEREGGFYRAEISRGEFQRRIQLPEDVDPEQVKAEFENGMLEIHLPKMEKLERRRITIE